MALDRPAPKPHPRTMRRNEPRQRWDDDDDDRVRVLLECTPAESPSIVARSLEREGFAVRTCTGPDDVACDLDRHGACDLVDGADVVVNLLDGDHGQALAERIAAARRPPAVVAHVRLAPGEDLPAEADSPVVLVRRPATRRALLQAIDEALDGRA